MDIDNEIRPIIRIEIQNDIATSMEVDTVDHDETEDGELSDNGTNTNMNTNTITENSKVNLQCRNMTTNITNLNMGNKWLNKEGGFMTGVDIFAEHELDKLNVRAKRFGIPNTESKSVMEHQIKDLYSSLRINPTDEKMIRFDAIHMRGVEEMSTKDVFGYFSVYGPSSIEWINDYSCNVVWLDNVSAARALLGLSKKISGFEYLDEDNPFILSDEFSNNKPPAIQTKTKASTQGRSILLIQQSQEKDDDEEDDGENEDEESKMTDNDELWRVNDVIELGDISIPIPPGYWRYGKPHPKAKAILLRYAFKTDKKPLKAEKLSGYYKKYGNPNFGGLRGLISESRKKQMRGNVKSNREVREVREDDGDDIDKNYFEMNSKNPWGLLAKSWSNEDRGIEFNEPKEIIPPRLRETTEQLKNVTNTTKTSSPTISVRERLGLKRKATAKAIDDDDDDDDETTAASSQEVTVNVATVERRSKVPRMRMYADEEQERLDKLKKIKNLIQSQNKNVTTNANSQQVDLRNRLILKSNRTRNNKQQSQSSSSSSSISLPQLKIEVACDDYNTTENNKQTNKSIFDRSRLHQTPRITQRNYKTSIDHEEDQEDEAAGGNLKYKRRSTVKVVVRNIPKPTIASTVSQNIRNSQNQTTLRKLSDREQFRRSENYDERQQQQQQQHTNNTQDLRDKISNKTKNSRGRLKVHTTNAKLFRHVKKESSSESNDTSDSEAESSDSSQSSSSSSSESASASSSSSSQSNDTAASHTRVLRKTASTSTSASATTKLPDVNTRELDKNIRGRLRIEVKNDNYKNMKAALKVQVENDNFMKS